MLRRHIAGAALLASLACFGNASAQFAINPQAGFSASSLSTDPQGTEASARFGYQAGVFLRFGNRLFLQPGLFWQRSGTELRTVSEIDIGTIKDEINLDAVFASLGAGYKILDASPLSVRLQGALAGTFILNVGENDLGLGEDNFNVVLLGAPAGIGVDILNIVTADVSYEFGLTNVFDEVFGLEVDAVNNVFRLNVGVIF